ncbi:MAG: hypothetical protein HRU70_04645 [Phycisphaeraceae bacterium]|nr:MAG: hypothetical protein HRU70_04645 [Phycisphaeraceae bacterium]
MRITLDTLADRPRAAPVSRAALAMVALRLALASVFLLAAALKLTDAPAGAPPFVGGVRAFARLIDAHGLFRYQGAISPVAVAWGVILAEIALGLALLMVRPPRWVVHASWALLAAFTVYLIAAFWDQQQVECNCFGRIAAGSLAWSVTRNVGFIALAVAWLVLDRRGRAGTPS